MQKIIYPSENGIAVIHPANCELTLEQIAHKDVPQGVPYKYIDESDIPTDRSQRHLWIADFSNPDGYGGQE